MAAPFTNGFVVTYVFSACTWLPLFLLGPVIFQGLIDINTDFVPCTSKASVSVAIYPERLKPVFSYLVISVSI